jgi:outer membrane protein assembly factor BamA
VATGWTTVHLMGASPESSAAPATRTVASLRLDGPSLPNMTLQEALTTRVGGPLRDVDLAADRVRIADILLERGHLGATVSPADVRWGGRGAHVTYRIAPGGIYHVGEVSFEGVLTEGVAAAPTVRPGDELSLERARRGVEQVDQWLAEHGAPDATVSYRLDVRHPDLRADVVYVVQRRRR